LVGEEEVVVAPGEGEDQEVGVASEEEGELHVAEDLIEEVVDSVGAVVVAVEDSSFCIFFY